MKAFWKKPISVLLLSLLILPGCGSPSAPEQETAATASPAVFDRATLGPTAANTPAPTLSPAPAGTCTPTPTPTPTPTATPIPLDRLNGGMDVEERLFPLLSSSPEPTATPAPYGTANPLMEDVGKLGAMVFAYVPILSLPYDTAAVVGRESYHLFYIHNVYNRQYYYVTTQEGRTGYIKAGQCVILSREDLDRYLNAARQLQGTVDFYSPDAFVRELQIRGDEGSMADRIYRALGRLGLDFDPFYYQVYQKALDNDERYPLYYKDDVYNSLLFRLFNSTGNLVYYDGHPTQWEYVPADGKLQKGDILFFTEALDKGSSGVLDGVEFVMKGPYSGALTGCGVYLGGGQALLLRGGQVKTVAWNESLQASLDCARRIHTAVFDEKQMIIEEMIAQIYDCLGTPYNNYRRKGEYSFDCSGLISWLLMRMEITPASYGRTPFTGTTASGLAQITYYYWHQQKHILLTRLAPRDAQTGLPSMDMLQRGDLIFLQKTLTWTRVGHVMMYLGDGRVIHSTIIDEDHGGTVVAFFRPELQRLYHSALRIDSISLPEQ